MLQMKKASNKPWNTAKFKHTYEQLGYDRDIFSMSSEKEIQARLDSYEKELETLYSYIDKINTGDTQVIDEKFKDLIYKQLGAIKEDLKKQILIEQEVFN